MLLNNLIRFFLFLSLSLFCGIDAYQVQHYSIKSIYIQYLLLDNVLQLEVDIVIKIEYIYCTIIQ